MANPINWALGKLGYAKATDVAAKVGAIVSSMYTYPYAVGQAPERDYAQLVDAYKSWVYTCIDKIGKSVAMVPLKLYVYRNKKGQKVTDFGWRHEYKSLPDKGEQRYFLKQIGYEKQEIYDHPFLDLIGKPNNLMTRFMLWYETMVRLELGGLCGWLLLRDRLGVPRKIWPLPLTKYAQLRVKARSDMTIEYWDYRDGDAVQQFKPDDVLLFKYPHPASPFQGMSPLMAQTYPYDLDLFLMQQQRSLFSHGAVPGLYLGTKETLTPSQVKELQEQIQDKFAGAMKAGETLITHSGLEAKTLGMSGRDAMIDRVAKFAREKLITAFDLSPGKVGLIDDVNRANADALNVTYINDCLRPKCMLIEEAIEAFLLPIYDEGLTADFALPDVADKQQALAERQANLGTAYSTINEERMREGKDPVPWGELPWMQAQMIQWEPGSKGGMPAPGDGALPFGVAPGAEPKTPSAVEPIVAPTATPTAEEVAKLPEVPKDLTNKKGGPGSGNYGHEGRSGQVGGSGPGGGENATVLSIDSERTGGSSIPADVVKAFDDAGVGDVDVMAKELGASADLRNFYRVNDRWLRGADSEAKEDIKTILVDNPTVRALTLYNDYSRRENEDVKFSDWLEKEQTLYRYGEPRGAFAGFTSSRSAAADATNSDLSKDSYFVVNAAPKDWLGSSMGGAGEVYLDPERLRSEKFFLGAVKVGGAGSGNYGHEGRPGVGVGGSGPGGTEAADRAARARESYKPATREVQRQGEANQSHLATILDGSETTDNAAFDVIVGRHMIEVKTIVRGTNDKITIHPESLRRKEREVRRSRGVAHTVVFDDRNDRVYYSKGLGSFRLGGMREVTLDDLKGVFGGKMWYVIRKGGPDSGNFGHEGRPGKELTT